VSTTKYVGVETEFGIQVVGAGAPVNPVLASSMVVGAYRGTSPRHVRWDHTDEHPMRDARAHGEPDAHQPPPDDELGLANTVLTNGARFYVDHAHPEYASPECADARSLVVWDKAGERILEEAAAIAQRTLPEGGRIVIHKNNTDGKGAAYGMHENYMLPRSVPFAKIVTELIPYFISRPIWAGAGRIGNEFGLADVVFQSSQRADFFEVEVGLETTLKRPIINTRDEPHADPARYRRLHVINGDANLCEVATYLKVGVTMLVLDALEDDALGDIPQLAHSVEAFHTASHDLTGRVPLELKDGRRMTSLELQWFYLQAVRAHAATRELTAVEQDVLTRWERVLVIADNDPFKLRGIVDWATKHDLLDRYASRHGLDWGSDRLKAVDLQYHDVRRDKGLYQRIAARGEVETIVTESEIQSAITAPPRDTRAYFRGRVLKKFGDDVVAAGWDSIILDSGRDALQRIPMMEPGRGTEAHVGAMLDRVQTAGELLDALRG
jgi:proteasome accessory factor PafA2